jgi:hypothetical protein
LHINSTDDDYITRDLMTGKRLTLVDLPGDLTNLWADDRHIIALNRALASPASLTVLSMTL